MLKRLIPEVGFNSLQERLKLYKITGVTNGQIDELVDFYSNL